MRSQLTDFKHCGVGRRGLDALWNFGYWRSVFDGRDNLGDQKIANNSGNSAQEIQKRRLHWNEFRWHQNELDEELRLALAGRSAEGETCNGPSPMQIAGILIRPPTREIEELRAEKN